MRRADGTATDVRGPNRQPPHRTYAHAGRTFVLLVLATTQVLAGAAAGAQRQAATMRSGLPPVVMTCPHHPDVVEDRPGECPLCRMALIPTRIDGAWMCPVHTVVTDTAKGACRLCGRTLVQVAVSLSWSCRGEPGEHLDPGLCADGTPRVMRRNLRPHGNHNPQHGGQFFMAPDNWHHLEGTRPQARLFRLFVYDDFARALGRGEMRAIIGRLVTRERYDARTGTATELEAVPLTLSRDGTALEARIAPAPGPAEMTAKIRLTRGAPQYRFDFTFDGLTVDAGAPDAARQPAPAPGAGTARAAARPVRPLTPALVEPPAAVPNTPVASSPPSMSEMLARLERRAAQTAEPIARGDFGDVWIPAFAAKTIALELEPHVAHLLPDVQRRAGLALRDVVRGAWRLDAIADAGDRPRLEDAHRQFAEAVRRALEAFADVR